MSEKGRVIFGLVLFFFFNCTVVWASMKVASKHSRESMAGVEDSCDSLQQSDFYVKTKYTLGGCAGLTESGDVHWIVSPK